MALAMGSVGSSSYWLQVQTRNPKPPPSNTHQQHKKPSKFPAKKTTAVLTKRCIPRIFTIPHQKPTCNLQRFAKQNKLKQALTILDYLDQQGIPVNPTSFTSLIAACVRTKSLTEGKQVHTHININGLENNEFLRTKLLNMYTTCGSVEDARQLFGECSSKNGYSWNTLLRGNVISGRWRYHDVLSTYTKMQELGVGLNVYSFSNVIKSFTGASALWQPLKIHALLINNGFVDTSILGMSLFDMYFKRGKIKLAHCVFEEIGERDVVVWGAMIAGFAHNRLQREALEYVRRMVEEGITPNSVMLTAILPGIGEVWGHKLG